MKIRAEKSEQYKKKLLIIKNKRPKSGENEAMMGDPIQPFVSLHFEAQESTAQEEEEKPRQQQQRWRQRYPSTNNYPKK